MKKVLSLFALVLMSCMGAWADVQVTSLNLLADGDVIYMHSNSADNWYFASDNSHPTSVIDACKFTLVAVNGQANTYYLQQGTKYVAAENAQAATNSNVTLMEESENAIPFTIVAHATVNGWKIQNNGNAISSGGSYWASNNAVRLSWTIYKVVPTITVTYNITATNNGKNPVNWTETKPVNLTGEAHTPELSYSYFSNFTITNDDKVVSEDNKTFNVTASHNLPMVPGKFYQIKFGDTYLSHVNDGDVSLYASSNTTDSKNLWYIKQSSENGPFFSLCNLYKEMAVHGTKGGSTGASEYLESFAYEFVASNSKFKLFEPGSTQNLGSHGSYGGANHSLGKWNTGRDGGAEFMVEEFDESIFTATSKYVGDLTYNSTETFETFLDSKTAANLKAALNYYNDANNKHAITIDADKYYVIESAKNSKIRIYIDDLTAHKFCYAEIEDHMLPGIFRFTSKSTENSNNWGESKECDTYKIYCVGATQKGYMGWGTYNDQVVNANVDDAAVVKVVSVGNASTFQLSSYDAVRDDNCTYAIGNNKTSVADNETGSLVSWNMYNSTNCNVWKIREVEAPAVPTQSVTITAAGAATFYTGKTLEIPAGVTAKILADDTTKDNGNGVYHLTYTALEDEIPAGTAVVLTGDATTYQFPRSLEPHDYVETSAAASDQNRLIGTLASGVVAAGNGQEGSLYALGNNPEIAGVAFYHFLGDNLTAGKAYLDASGLGVSGARAFAIFDEEGEQTTSINGLFIEAASNAVAFDLAGRRINANTKGISIVNSKKVIR